MANEWDSEVNCMIDWVSQWEIAGGLADDILQDRTDLNLYLPYISDTYIKAAFGRCAQAMFHTHNAIEAILNKRSVYNPEYNACYYAAYYSKVAAGELTWKEIVIAFGEASDPGRMWIVTELDWMRKVIWDKNPNIKWQENPAE